MVMIDLGHEKKSLGVISVTHVTETLQSAAAQVDNARACPLVTGPGVKRRAVGSTQDADAER
jgi:hypothetical protein